MTSEASDTDEDSAVLEEFLAELEEDGSNSRYDAPHSSDNSHTQSNSDTSIVHSREVGGPLFSITHADKVVEEATQAQRVHLRAVLDEKANDARSAHLHVDPLSNTATEFTSPISPLELPHANHCGMSAFAVERPLSPPPSAPCGCSWFFLPSPKRAEKQKKSGSREVDANGLFNVKSTEKEFKRASKKEKQLTQEAQEFLKTVAST